MSTRYRFVSLLIPALWRSACAAPPTPRKLAQDAVAAMGGMEKLQAIKELNLKVDTMVGGHGGVGTFADFVKAAAPPASSN